jgi:signal peptidase II
VVRLKRKRSFALFLVTLFALDWGTRLMAMSYDGGFLRVIPGVLELNVLRNRGLLFGWGFELSGFTVMSLRFSALLILFGLIMILFRLQWHSSEGRLKNRCLSALLLILTGGIGNTLEGIFRGFVTDFIHIYPLPVINFADIWIVTGTLIIFINLFFQEDPCIPFSLK